MRSLLRLAGKAGPAWQLTGGVALATLFAWLAPLFWFFGLFAHFHLHWGLAACALAFALAVFGRPRPALVCLMLVAANLYPVLAAAPLRGDGADGLRVLSLNLQLENRDYATTLAYLRNAKADVIVLQEVSEDWAPMLKNLSNLYPHQKTAFEPTYWGLALLSRYPVEEAHLWAGKVTYLRAVWARIRLPDDRRITVATSHLAPPRSDILADLHRAQLAELADFINDFQGPLVVAGDLNETPWSPAFQDFTATTDLRIGPALAAATWPAPLGALGIPIDHILVREPGRVAHLSRGPALGSDHHPLVGTVVF